MFRKSHVSVNEIRFQYQAQLNCGTIAPTIRDFGENPDGTMWMTMDRIDAKNLAEKYGDNPEELPVWIWYDIHRIVRTLFYAGNMEYIDITPYNFMEKNGIVWCIDYEHASEREGDQPKNWFLQEFLQDNSMREWNPDFL
jgi:hypothetical protein